MNNRPNRPGGRCLLLSIFIKIHKKFCLPKDNRSSIFRSYVKIAIFRCDIASCPTTLCPSCGRRVLWFAIFTELFHWVFSLSSFNGLFHWTFSLPPVQQTVFPLNPVAPQTSSSRTPGFWPKFSIIFWGSCKSGVSMFIAGTRRARQALISHVNLKGKTYFLCVLVNGGAMERWMPMIPKWILLNTSEPNPLSAPLEA